ncbi:MBL fold metallo-hydrolase [Halobium salinum]|uniref:MBL fold metallo-hydrolase n=1 Tax=Halobium salinum TaxID=1364940 RepID=A0ABD5P8A1_9EURY|nr:MBL fold metallo-hydrolase [Halobium salinum]
MHLTFLGTGSAMPTPDRVQTGLLLERAAEGTTQRLLVDCGSGVLSRLAGTEAGYESVASVLLTHHHLDHVADLLPLLKARWLAGEEHLEVVGPTGTKALLDDLLAVHDYLQDRVDLRVREVTADSTFEVAGFEVESYETRHSMPCLAYRFAGHRGDGSDGGDGGDGSGEAADADEPGRDVVFGADSEAFAGLANFADGAGVLIHDCSFPDEVDVSNHPTPTQLGEALAGHDYGRVYLTHLYPHTEGKHEEMLESVARNYDGDVRFAKDGLRIEM